MNKTVIKTRRYMSRSVSAALVGFFKRIQPKNGDRKQSPTLEQIEIFKQWIENTRPVTRASWKRSHGVSLTQEEHDAENAKVKEYQKNAPEQKRWYLTQSEAGRLHSYFRKEMKGKSPTEDETKIFRGWYASKTPYARFAWKRRFGYRMEAEEVKANADYEAAWRKKHRSTMREKLTADEVAIIASYFKHSTNGGKVTTDEQRLFNRWSKRVTVFHQMLFKRRLGFTLSEKDIEDLRQARRQYNINTGKTSRSFTLRKYNIKKLVTGYLTKQSKHIKPMPEECNAYKTWVSTTNEVSRYAWMRRHGFDPAAFEPKK